MRTYVDSQLTFLEVKNKSNKGRTKKKRIEVETNDLRTLAPDKTDWLREKSWYSLSALQPQLHTRFERITLVNRAKTERLTIDTRLWWENVQTGQNAALGDVIIIELKRDGYQPSEMVEILRSLRVNPMKISKYCIGTALTNATVKNNRFRPKLRQLAKLAARG